MKSNHPYRLTEGLKRRFGLLTTALILSSLAFGQTVPCGKSCGPELVTNGDFESGNSGFSTDFHLIGSPYPAAGRNYRVGDCQVYTIDKNAYTVHPNNWWTRNDHGKEITGTAGNFFIGDAQCNGTPQRAWYQTVPVVQGKTYVFSAWASNLDNPSYKNVAVFTVRQGASVITASQPITSKGTQTEGRWTQVCGTYLATATGNVTIEVGVVPSIPSYGLSGADFGLDDISFKAASPGDPRFTVSRRTECANDFVTFLPETGVGAGVTHTWDFGAPDAITSSTSSPVGHAVYPTPGTYTVRHTISSPTTICSEVYETTIEIKSDCGSPSCNSTLDNCGANLIVNGDFESGSSGITSGLFDIAGDSPVRFGSCGGRYTVATSTASFSGQDSKHSVWSTTKDHTTGSGKFMIADPPCTSDGVVIWSRSVTVVSGGVYNFKAYVSNLCATNNQPVILLRVNGNPVTFPQTVNFNSSANQKWTEICGSYTATANGEVLLEIEAGASSDDAVAADLGLDDVGFYRLGKVDPTYTLASGRHCAGTATTFTSNPNAPGVIHSWTFGTSSIPNSSDANPSVTYSNAGKYQVTHSVSDPSTGCQKMFKDSILIENCCSVTSAYSFVPSTSDCSVQFTNGSSSANSTITGYLWTINDQNGTVTTYTSQNVNHTFSGPGPHKVCLKVTGKLGNETCQDEFCQDITSPCEIPSCVVNPHFDWSLISQTSTPTQTKTLRFTNSSTYSANTTPTSFVWTFTNTTPPYEVGQEYPGDRTFNLIAGEGNTIVTLTVQGKNGSLTCSGQYCQIIDLKTLAGTNCATRPGLKQQNDGGLGGSSENESSLNYFPNPVIGKLTVEIEVKIKEEIAIDILDLNGKVIASISKGIQDVGKHQFDWSPTTENSTGIYMLRMNSTNKVEYKKIYLNK